MAVKSLVVPMCVTVEVGYTGALLIAESVFVSTEVDGKSLVD